MARKTKNARPKPVTADPVSLRVVRGPHADDTTADPRDQRWYWRGFRGQEPLGSLGWLTLAGAQAKAGELAQQQAHRDDEAAPVASGTIQALIRDYVAFTEARVRKGEIRNSTAETARRVGRVYPSLFPDGQRLVSLKASHVQAAVDHRATTRIVQKNGRIREGIAHRTIKLEIAVIRQAWGWATERGLVSRPWPAPTIVDRGRSVEKFTPSEGEVRRCLAALDRNGLPWIALRTLAETGMRLHEFQALTWDRVDLDPADAELGTGPHLRIPQKTKTGFRRVDLTPSLAAELARWRASQGFAEGDGLAGLDYQPYRYALQSAINAACIETGVRRWTVHALRRVTVQRLRRAQVPVVAAAAFLGHSVTTMMKHYDEADAADRAQVLSANAGATWEATGTAVAQAAAVAAGAWN